MQNYSNRKNFLSQLEFFNFSFPQIDLFKNSIFLLTLTIFFALNYFSIDQTLINLKIHYLIRKVSNEKLPESLNYSIVTRALQKFF